MEQGNVLLSVEKLNKTYEGVGQSLQALKDVSFHVYEGEHLAVMGTSGSGKNTLLNILGALDEPSDGIIKLKEKYDKNIFHEPNKTYRRENIGLIFQSFNLFKDLTVEDNIALPLILNGTPDIEIEEKVNRIIDIVGLTPWKAHRPVKLSGSQQQRVAIGRALICSPPIILADELTGNFDLSTTTDIVNVLVEINKQFNQSIIMVTHDAYVAQYADRVLFFHDCQIVDEYICNNNNDDMDNILKTISRIMENE